MSTIGAKMKARRLELGLTLQQVGDAIGVTKVTVLKYENGQIKNMRMDQIENLARILQTTPEMIYDDQVESLTPPSPVQDERKYSLTPQQEILFDASEDLTPTEMDAVLTMINALKSTRR